MIEIEFSTQTWALEKPFRITGHEFHSLDLLYVTLRENGYAGRGEGAGVYYLNESGESMTAHAESIAADIRNGAGRQELLELLPAGGARNAIDCALWDLEAKRAGKRIWELTSIFPGQTRTSLTVGISTPEEMASAARELDSQTVKVKLDDELPLERLAAIREARPDAEIIVDVNGGWSFEQLVELAPGAAKLGVAMIEQPLPRGDDAKLEGYKPPITLCADESCLNVAEFEQAARRYQMINIKLDKTGGLTEALQLADLAEKTGVELMVGNMMGTSLAMAPAFVVAQLCKYADLDGAMFIKGDRDHAMRYSEGFLSAPTPQLWG